MALVVDHSETVVVFAAEPGGGNPAPVVVDADAMSDDDMQRVARSHGLESAFVVRPPVDSSCDLALRFWVPEHEMEMCGHATVGAVWLLDRLGRLPAEDVTVWTPSGRVAARVRTVDGERSVEISQPSGRVTALPRPDEDLTRLLEVLRISPEDLGPHEVQNAGTSRVKTLVPLRSVALLDALQPDWAGVEALCSTLGSTGLYPYAVVEDAQRTFEARQFPRSSGYPEDAATGIAAAALAFGLLAGDGVEPTDEPILVRQGRAMGRPSQIRVRVDLTHGAPRGCWIGGAVQLADQP
jgi:PhzF family phenazine biosynthesis protein